MASDDGYLVPYSDDEEGSAGEEWEMEEENDGEESDEYDSLDPLAEGPDPTRKDTPYVILDEAQIRKLQEEDIANVSSVLSIPKPQATLLLRHHKWNATESQDKWFADEEKVRKAVGLLPSSTPEISAGRSQVCGICFDSYPRSGLPSAACGHPFCGDCWAAYIAESVSNGPGCLGLRCPTPKCGAAVGPDMFDSLGGDEERKKYRRYLLRSYVEDNPKRKWCPAPGCSCAVDFVVGSEVRDVCCKCSHSFCWQCSEETHRPLSCETVAKWIKKNNSESETTNWVLAYTKPCPKCEKPIEKNQGCMHMMCRPPCRFEFCWLCMQPWAEHAGFGACSRFKGNDTTAGQKQRADTTIEKQREDLERYTHYYERWAANHLSRQKAVEALHQWKAEKLEKLRLVQRRKSPTAEDVYFDFVLEAYAQIIESRRVLKWAYAFGYYLEPHKEDVFDYLKGTAESYLEELHGLVEKGIEAYLDDDSGETLPTGAPTFGEFRQKVITQNTKAVRYSADLVRALEDGLHDVIAGKIHRYSSYGGDHREGDMSSFSVLVDGQWTCVRCTFANPASVTRCLACSDF